MRVPALRFKNAKGENYPEWKTAQIGDYVDFLSGYPFDGDDITEDKSGVLLMRGTNITEGTVRNSPDIDRYYVGNITKLEKFLLKENDLVVGMDGSKVGKNSALVKSNSINSLLVQRVARLRETKLASIFYVYQNINSFRFHTYVDKVKTSSGIPHISAKQIKEFEIKFPCIEEQNKIANFLTAVDKKITQLTQKCELLAQYKKGVMQQVFSQKLRFKNDDGHDFPDWEECEFGKVFEFIPTNSYSREMLTYENGVIQNIHYGDIHTRYKSNFKLENENVPFLSSEVDVSKIKDSQFCRNGDIVIADASEDYADVGKAIEVIEVGTKRLVAGLHTYIARNMNEKLALGFGGYLMQSSDVRFQIKVLATGVSVLSISKGNLAKVTIKLPCKSEQTKIANFLTAIDEKLTHTQNQLAAAKQYKQGLLQQMFV